MRPKYFRHGKTAAFLQAMESRPVPREAHIRGASFKSAALARTDRKLFRKYEGCQLPANGKGSGLAPRKGMGRCSLPLPAHQAALATTLALAGRVSRSVVPAASTVRRRLSRKASARLCQS